MSAPKPRLPTPASGLTVEVISDGAMDSMLANRSADIDAKLTEAHDDKARGDFAPLEPLDVLLREARERARTKP